MSGVLLYYKYVDLLGLQEEIKQFYGDLCTRLGLVGRIRVAEDGVNVTVGGSMENLEKHITAVKENNVIKGADIDFKLQASSGAVSERTREEAKFDKLVIRICEELVTLGPLAKCRAKLENTAIHLTPEQFHDKIVEAQHLMKNGNDSSMVLVDTRNFYEARIGQFKADAIESVDPEIRCFSDFPGWVDANLPSLVNKTVMMYCTGGVRCERASAYLREKGPGLFDVYQLKGGIQRYLERFPDGGFFEGKNFVYDDRNAVGGEQAPRDVVRGRCLLCRHPWDDYSQRLRCSHCRQLLLVCSFCCKDTRSGASLNDLLCEICMKHQVAESLALSPVSMQSKSYGNAISIKDELLSAAATSTAAEVTTGCENEEREGRGEEGCPNDAASGCGATKPGRGSGKADGEKKAASDDDNCGKKAGALSTSQSRKIDDASQPRKLRILCLHGFRQSSKKFEGRTCALRKKLKDLADFTFVDGPHILPLYYKAVTSSTENANDEEVGIRGDSSVPASQERVSPHPLLHLPPIQACKRAWLVSPGDLEAMMKVADVAEAAPVELSHNCVAGSSGMLAMDSSASGEASVNDDSFDAAALLGTLDVNEPSSLTKSSSTEHSAPPAILKEQQTTLSSDGRAAWVPAPERLNEKQFLEQTEGWAASLAALEDVVRTKGPFDGVMGFSQGAAVTGVLCVLREHELRRREAATALSSAEEADGEKLPPLLNFKFAILASGFPSPVPEHQTLLSALGGSASKGGASGCLHTPSLHVYGNAGDDRQVQVDYCERLSQLFDPASRRVVCHQSAHIIPATANHIRSFREFLISQFS